MRTTSVSYTHLPYFFLMVIAKGLKSIGIAKQHHYLKIVGLFKRTWFNSVAKVVSNLKYRLSWGKNGNEAVGAYTTLAFYFPNHAFS